MYVQNIERRRLQRILAIALGLAAFAVIMSGCGSESAGLDLEDIGMQVQADLQAGATFDLAFAAPNDVTLDVTTAPAGVTADITKADDSTQRLTVVVDADTPRGAYYLGIEAKRGGQVSEVYWPFTVTGF